MLVQSGTLDRSLFYTFKTIAYQVQIISLQRTKYALISSAH